MWPFATCCRPALSRLRVGRRKARILRRAAIAEVRLGLQPDRAAVRRDMGLERGTRLGACLSKYHDSELRGRQAVA